ncbi:vWA domain-containing protein [Microlunatus soli]|uniref:VWA domain containing CoxE-like protein n=1 Tax=Microlunatus soli TaxID=630515 RepID=A0A1H1Z7S8_9ACTN|nr:VWA domain-containing protein [Microlunatus soli]SDT29266.1 VWA domain containing CoxE-like protein [Microlunatus soli]
MTSDDQHAADPTERERLTRWRLVLGGGDADGLTTTDIESGSAAGDDLELSDDDRIRDRALSELYDGNRRGGLGASAPRVARWLGDIRGYFPSSVVQVMQTDAMQRLGLHRLLTEPEMLEAVQPDIGLVSTLIGLNRVIPEHSRSTARRVVRQVTDDLERRLAAATVQAVSGALNRAAKTRRPRHADIDWGKTIAANLQHYLPEYRTVVPERLIGHARRTQQVQRRIILCIDQSGSMAESIVYASVFGAVLASLRTVATSMIVFDTEVVDLTEESEDPVEVLFGVQLGGGTDINRALAYCQGLIDRPEETVLILISDLYEGGIAEEMLHRSKQIIDSGATMITLLALSDSGAPSYDAGHAVALSELGVPAFACTPDLFGDLMAAAIDRRDIAGWAADNDISVAAPSDAASGSAPRNGPSGSAP